MDLRRCTLRERSYLRSAGLETLRLAYFELCKELNEEFRDETQRTQKEERVANELKKGTKLNFEQSMWIGKRNVDFFFPYLGGVVTGELECSNKRFKGLVLEVDGSVHDQYGKMRKDNSKYELIHRLGIGLVTIENADLREPTVKAILERIQMNPRIDHRAKERLLRNIYLHTILSNYDLVRKAKIQTALGILQNVKGAW